MTVSLAKISSNIVQTVISEAKASFHTSRTLKLLFCFPLTLFLCLEMDCL